IQSSTRGWILSKKNLYWLCQAAGWGTILLLLCLNNTGPENSAIDIFVQEYFDKKGVDPNSFLYSISTMVDLLIDSLFTTFCLFLISHLFRFFIHRRLWLKLYFAQLLPRIAIAAFVLSFIALPFQYLFSWIFTQTNFDTSEYVSAFIEGALFYLFWLVGYFLYHYVNNYNRNLKLEAMINEFELNKLKSQLNPHFIFNALNSVKALVDEDPEKAKDSIYQLSSILRSSLMMDKKKVIPFEEELSIVQNYLALEGTRFEERLQVEYDISPQSLSYKLPPMMLQTIVENGIKHGISKRKNGGYIRIKTAVSDDKLFIEIRNSGIYNPEAKASKTGGYGLKSTIQRLELLYDKEAEFSIGNGSTDEVITQLIIPTWQKHEPTTLAPVNY
ncbi:MAG: sensor histidine kinase, partial [Flammeovirgaceae bacterium]